MAATQGNVFQAFTGTVTPNGSGLVISSVYTFQDPFSGFTKGYSDFCVTAYIGGASNKYSGGVVTPTWTLNLWGSNNAFATNAASFNILGPQNILDIKGNTILANGVNTSQLTSSYVPPSPNVAQSGAFTTKMQYDPRTFPWRGCSFSSVVVYLQFTNYPGGGQTCPAFVEVTPC